jgi:hypothetical protein
MTTPNDDTKDRRHDTSPPSEPPSQARPHPSEPRRTDAPGRDADEEPRGSEALRGIVRKNQASRTYEEDDDTSSRGARFEDRDDRLRFRRRHFGSQG